MPSICRNVNRRNPLQTVPGVANANNLGDLDQGQTPGGLPYITLHFDTDTANSAARNTAACPSNWNRNHACPEADQPPIVASGSSWSNGGYPGLRYNPNNLLNQGDPGYNIIGNLGNTASSGMFWSCDEWPPATTIEGSAGVGTYCAPMSGKCSSLMRSSGIPSVDSEQDIQAKIHQTLRFRLTNTGGVPQPNTVYQFFFQTMWDDQADVAGAAIMWTNINTNAGAVDTAFKRSLAKEQMHIDLVFDNGTIASYIRPLSETEIEEHIEHAEREHKKRQQAKLEKRQSTANTTVSPVKQNFQVLLKAPPLAIIDISRSFIQRLAHVPISSLIDQILSLPASLPAFITNPAPNSTFSTSSVAETSSSISPSASVISKNLGRGTESSQDITRANELVQRQNTNECSASSPCPDGSCCNNSGGCGYGPDNCGAGNCTNTCNATALCGRDSLGGSVICPLNVCCSYYGYCGTDTDFCDSPQPDAPCQAGFGSCSSIAAPSCGGSSALGRSIAYYQVANTRTRECQRITPSQIDITGLTHLNLAFATIDPSSFTVLPADPADVAIYAEFTALKSSSLETWISIGGWDFNDPGPTQTTWSQMASTSSNRAAFISSLQSFMTQYGFQGADLDWEYPGAPDRNGNPADTENFVDLLREMRAAFGTSFGISATLPSSYWYLRWFDPIAMEPYVDFFGLMTYDLHGPWDANVKTIGQVIIGQTNIPEIANWTLPLWYDKVDPSKINLGLAYYGRGYTVADVDCTTVGCMWSGPSRPGPCTIFGGVMSLEEITQLIPEVGVQPTLDSDAMMKYLVWSDQWIGYDDIETIAMKKLWASSHCFGGTMIWSIDLFSGSGSGNTPDGNGTSSDPGGGGGQSGSTEPSGGDGVVYIDPTIWGEDNPVINCEPPCTFILPPLVLPSPTTITFPPYVTSLDVAWSDSTGWTSIVETTTLTIPPVTTTQIPFWEFTVTDTNSASTVITTFYPTSSILPPTFEITDNPNPLGQSGVTHSPVTRTITPPPFPYSFSPPVTNPSSTTSHTGVAAVFSSVVTYHPGHKGPLCKSGCGIPCLIFCDSPCLLNCKDGGNDYDDPKNPKPPSRPTPTEPVENMPTGTVASEAPDPDGDDPEDEEEEEEDEQCAYEFNLPAPTYVDPDTGSSPTQTVAPPPPPPTPQPSPNPTPPSPNPSTEKVHCYNSGAMTGRGSMIDAVTAFCTRYAGTVLDGSNLKTQQTLSYDDHNAGVCFGALGCTEVNHLTLTVTNGCKFTIDGPDSTQDCGRIFREAIDRCDQSSTKYKQGGTITSNCAIYDIDPNNYW